MQKRVVIELPGIKAISRNDTTGHYINYRKELIKAKQWLKTFGKRVEYHFENRVDVHIDAYFDTRLTAIVNKNGQKTNVWYKAIDTPNIDDKIFTDILLQYETLKVAGKLKRFEQSPWFIKEDKPEWLRFVTKQSVPSDHYKVVITITEIDEEINVSTM